MIVLNRLFHIPTATYCISNFIGIRNYIESPGELTLDLLEHSFNVFEPGSDYTILGYISIPPTHSKRISGREHEFISRPVEVEGKYEIIDVATGRNAYLAVDELSLSRYGYDSDFKKQLHNCIDIALVNQLSLNNNHTLYVDKTTKLAPRYSCTLGDFRIREVVDMLELPYLGC